MDNEGQEIKKKTKWFGNANKDVAWEINMQGQCVFMGSHL